MAPPHWKNLWKKEKSVSQCPSLRRDLERKKKERIGQDLWGEKKGIFSVLMGETSLTGESKEGITKRLGPHLGGGEKRTTP